MSSLRVEIGKKTEYKNLLYTVSDIIYYCVDTNEVFRGDKEINQVVRIVAAESPSPYQNVLYVIGDVVKSFNGTSYEILGTAYKIGTSKLYTLEMALEDLKMNTESSTSVQNIPEDTNSTDSFAEDYESYRNNMLSESEYSSTISQVDNMSDLESISDGVLSTFTTIAVSNIRTWDNTSYGNEIVIDTVDDLDTINIDDLQPNSVISLTEDDITTRYYVNDNSLEVLGVTSSLDSYYEDVDYVATPLSYNTFSANNDILSVTLVEEIEAMDFVTFAATSGAATRGVVSSPTADIALDDDIATTGYVAVNIAASTQQILSYVDGLSQFYDHKGAAAEALERATAYTDERLRWHRLV